MIMNFVSAFLLPFLCNRVPGIDAHCARQPVSAVLQAPDSLDF
jgi:hypothetical protein